MVNATQMGKAFGKQPKDWLKKNEQASRIISCVSARRNLLPSDLQQVVYVYRFAKMRTDFIDALFASRNLDSAYL